MLEQVSNSQEQYAKTTLSITGLAVPKKLYEIFLFVT